MILAFDVSTSIIGVCLLDLSGNLILLDHIDLKNYTFWESVDVFKNWIITKDLMDIEYIFVEEPKKGFMFGRSSNNTILLLNRFNAICSYILYSVFNKQPIYINESSARKKCGLKIFSPKKAGKPQKEQAFEQASAMDVFKNYPWSLKRTGKVKDCHLDEMDAYIVAKCGYLNHVK